MRCVLNNSIFLVYLGYIGDNIIWVSFIMMVLCIMYYVKNVFIILG